MRVPCTPTDQPSRTHTTAVPNPGSTSAPNPAPTACTQMAMSTATRRSVRRTASAAGRTRAPTTVARSGSIPGSRVISTTVMVDAASAVNMSNTQGRRCGSGACMFCVSRSVRRSPISRRRSATAMSPRLEIAVSSAGSRESQAAAAVSRIWVTASRTTPTVFAASRARSSEITRHDDGILVLGLQPRPLVTGDAAGFGAPLDQHPEEPRAAQEKDPEDRIGHGRVVDGQHRDEAANDREPGPHRRRTTHQVGRHQSRHQEGPVVHMNIHEWVRREKCHQRETCANRPPSQKHHAEQRQSGYDVPGRNQVPGPPPRPHGATQPEQQCTTPGHSTKLTTVLELAGPPRG